jgi:isocitrate dehydrogenase (NAD+)
MRVFESFHGRLINEGGANPLPLLLPALEMLAALDQNETARRIRGAVETVLSEGRIRTADLGGKATTMEMAEAIVAALPG